LVFVLHPLGDDGKAQRLGHCKDGPHDRCILEDRGAVGDERAIDLQCGDGQLAQVRQTRVAGAEVVDRDRHAAARQRTQDVDDVIQVGQEDPLGHLDHEARQVAAFGVARAPERGFEVLRQQLARRDVHRHVQVQALLRQLDLGPTGLDHGPVAQAFDQARAFGQRDEFGRRHRAELAGRPTHQRLDTDYPAGGCGHDRLVDLPYFVELDRGLESVIELKLALGNALDLIGKEHRGVAPHILGDVERAVRMPHQQVGTVAVLGV